MFPTVLRIRIRRIRMFFGFLNPDPDPSIIKQKNSKNNLDSYFLWLLYDFLSLKTAVNEPSKSTE